ncbi:MAG: GerAB/ArcD/ProY family transporter [Bacillota bacterium]|uniref:GerAB/ArcD/ProY family transporter n=1 Tax=Rossellomorea sp. FM04394 TaxID=3243076 RepID=UPI0035A6C401
MNKRSIYLIHIFSIIILSSGLMVHVLILPSLLGAGKRDSWISVLLSVPPLFLWIFLLYYIYKKLGNQDPIQFIRTHFGKKISNMIGYLLSLYFMGSAFVTLNYTANWSLTNYTFEVPFWVILTSITVTTLYGTYKGVRTIGMIAFICLPVVTFLGFFVASGNMKNKDYSRLFPIFENGMSDALFGMIYVGAGIFELAVFLFLVPFVVTGEIKMKWLIGLGILLAFLTLGPVTGAISEFGIEESMKMKNPAYEQWRLLTLGEYITRLDSLSILQWLSGAFVRISISVYITEKLLFTTENKRFLKILILYGVLFLGALIPWNEASFFTFLYTYFLPYSLVLLVLCIGVLGILVKIGGKKS